MMKKIFLFLLLWIFFLFSSVWIISAQWPVVSSAGCTVNENMQGSEALTSFFESCQTNGISAKPNTGMTNQGMAGISEKVRDISSQALRYAGLFAVGALVIAGILYTTAYGDSSRLEKAKKTAIFALIGLILALTSYALVNAVLYFLFALK